MENLPTAILKNCFHGPWPWSRQFLSSASIESVLERLVLGLGIRFFFFESLTSNVVSSTPRMNRRLAILGKEAAIFEKLVDIMQTLKTAHKYTVCRNRYVPAVLSKLLEGFKEHNCYEC